MDFEKNDILLGPQKLIFEKEFRFLSIEECWLDKNNGLEYVTCTIAGKCRICSDDDLAFIFSI